MDFYQAITKDEHDALMADPDARPLTQAPIQRRRETVDIPAPAVSIIDAFLNDYFKEQQQ